MNRVSAALFVALWLTGCDRPPAQNASAPSERYRLAVSQDGNAWRLDTVTGEMDKCWQGMGNEGNVTCYPATFPNR